MKLNHYKNLKKKIPQKKKKKTINKIICFFFEKAKKMSLVFI